MTDAHNHDGCNHNHAPNPYTDPQRASQYHEVVIQLFRMTILTCHVDPHLSARYAAAVGWGVAGTRDPIPTYRAVMWELADLVQIMANGKEPMFSRQRCANPEHHHGDADTAEEEFGEAALHAFFTAAAVGDHQGAVNVIDGMAIDENDPDANTHTMTVALFANAMVSLAYTSMGQIADPLALFDDE